MLQDPFDYEAEDRLVAAWKAALETLPDVHWQREPGYTLSYSGPGGRARRSPALIIITVSTADIISPAPNGRLTTG